MKDESGFWRGVMSVGELFPRLLPAERLDAAEASRQVARDFAQVGNDIRRAFYEERAERKRQPRKWVLRAPAFD